MFVLGLVCIAAEVQPLQQANAMGVALPSTSQVAGVTAPQLLAPSFFGMNMYFTTPARSDGEVATLTPLAQAIHIGLSREQISWATYDAPWGPGFFDARILYDRDGTYQLLVPQNGAIQVTLLDRPCYLWRIPTGPVQHYVLPLVYQ